MEVKINLYPMNLRTVYICPTNYEINGKIYTTYCWGNAEIAILLDNNLTAMWPYWVRGD